MSVTVVWGVVSARPSSIPLFRPERVEIALSSSRCGPAGPWPSLEAEATDIAAASDFLHLRWHLLMSRAEVLWMVGESDERAFTLAEAVRVADQKGNVVAAEQASRLLASAQTVQLKRSP